MRRVYQEVVDSKLGDCHGACLASIFGLEKPVDLYSGRTTSQFIKTNEWLSQFNLCEVVQKIGAGPMPNCVCILVVKSALFDGFHSVVYDGRKDEIYHNPNREDPRGTSIPIEDWVSFHVFALVNPKEIFE